MDKIEVVPTERLVTTAALVRDRLPSIVEQTDGPIYFRKAAGELPQYLYFVGGLAVWLALDLREFSKAFWAKLGDTSAQKLLDTFQSSKAAEPDNPALKMAQTIADAKASTDVEFDVILKVEIGEKVELSLALSANSPERLAALITKFLANLETVAEHLNANLEDSEFGQIFAFVTCTPENSLKVEWHSRSGRQELIL